MYFNSSEFALFLPIVLVLYTAIFRHERLRDGLLLVASYIFYMAWYWQYAGLIAFSTCVDFFVGKLMAREERQNIRRLLLIFSLVTNLGLLAVFKYFNFFADTSRQILTSFGIDIPLFHYELLLPVGISFYTFQSLSYTIDLYRKHINEEKNFVKFATFVAFFPQLVAGPIVRAADFLPQINRTPVITREQFSLGLSLVFIGLFKKIVIADLLAQMAVDSIFANPGAYSSWDLLMALYGYTFQIYCDFSGYSDIAIGVAAMFGFVLPQNFNRPYLAQNIREFWTRWHISLSTWLRDYLYISLGGNKGTRYRVAFNLMVTMVLGGLWHGAAMNFVIWGGFHGLLLVLSRNVSKHSADTSMVSKIYKVLFTFHLVVFSWLLFRVTGMDNFMEYLVGFSELTIRTQLSPFFYLILVVAVFMHIFPQDFFQQQVVNRFVKQHSFIQAGIYTCALMLFLGLTLESPAFIYFQF